MATMIEGADSFDALVYGELHPGTINFLNSQQQSFGVTDMLTEKAMQFRQSIESQVQRFNVSSFMRTARAAIRKVSNVWRTDDIIPMSDIGQMQHAKPLMQRYIMAEPTLREMYIEQRVDGYSESYVDTDPNKVGYDHYDFRRVTNAVFTNLGREEQSSFEAVTYYEQLRGNDRELHFEEQQDVMVTWSNLRPLLLGQEDPTSKYNASL